MKDTLLNLTIGAILELERITDGVPVDLQSELIGYTKNQSIILTHPIKDNTPVQIDIGDGFFISLKQSDSDITFKTEVVAVLNSPYPHLHTTYPKEIRPQGWVR